MRVLLAGLLAHMRRSGAVDVDYIWIALEAATTRSGLEYFAAQAALGVRSTDALPVRQFRRSAAPRPPTRRSGIPGFQYLAPRAQTNWYAH